MNKNNSAFRYALKILGISERSEFKLKESLRKKGYNQEEISEAIRLLKKNNLINDERFSELLIEKYIKKGKGINYIRHVLSDKGIPDDIISTTLARMYPESLEYKKAKELLSSLKKPFRKALITLSNAGFSEQTIEKIAEETSDQ
ncbi:MAG: recombination regulator RecX [bacterium]|nr:recombination regulator RecX [bacterium]